jgi:electron transfer flavoprotein alpha subunit
MARIFAYIVHKGGLVDDTAAELQAAAKQLDPSQSPTAVVTGSGAELDAVCEALCASWAEVWKITSPELAYPNAEVVRKALVQVLPKGCITLIPHAHFGVDLSPGLSIKMDAAYLPDVIDLQAGGGWIKAVRQEFGGQVSVHVTADMSNGAVINVRPGAFKPVDTPPVTGQVVDKSSDIGSLACGRRYIETVVAETGDVDISKEPVLVSVGRGIQEQDNIAIVEELASVMGAAVSCSRPVVDAKWMEKSRQVGSSGQTVKPKIYMALGISGSFQHLAGVKGNPFIIAVNKNPRAPIFQVADVGIVADILEFLPELSNAIRHEVKAAAAVR